MKAPFLPRYEREIKTASIVRWSHGRSTFSTLYRANTFFMDSAAEAITFFLAGLNLGPHTVVGVPLYTCSSVAQAVKSANHHIKFLDILLDETGYHLDMAQIGSVDVLILIHYFGAHYKNIAGIRDAHPSLVILEDCSHVSYKGYSGCPIADASVFSFNLHKPISCGVGGCLMVHNPVKALDIQSNYGKLPELCLRADLKRFLKIILKSYAHVRLVQHISRKYLANRRKLRSRSSPYHEIKPHRLSFFSRSLLGNQYDCSEDSSFKLNYLRIPEGVRLRLDEVETAGLLYYPVFLPDRSHRDDLNARLHELSIDSFVLWENSLFNASYYSEMTDDCQKTMTMLDRILFLPKELVINKVNYDLFNKVIEFLNDIDTRRQ